MIINTIKYIEEKIIWAYNYKKNRNHFLSSFSDHFDNPNTLSKLYVWPRLQDKNPADEIYSSVDTSKPALDVLKPFLDGNNTHKDGRNHLIILGDAGMGKSSFLLMLKLNSMSFFGRKKYKFELFKIGQNVLNDVAQIKDKINTILLLDALDEDVESWGNVKPRLLQLIQNTLGFRKVIITCRTQFFPVEERNLLINSGIIKIYEYRIEALFLSLFREKDITDYLKRKFGINKTKINKAKRIILKMKDLKARPLILSHIDDLLYRADSYVDTFSIFNGMTTAWLERESRKNQHLSSEKLRETCIFIAKHMSSEKTRSITKRQLEILVDIGDISTNLENIDIGGRSLLNKNSDGDFRFSHFSIQELLVAEAITHGYMDLKSLSEINITSLMKEFILQAGSKKKLLVGGLSGKCSSAFVKIDDFPISEYESILLSKPKYPLIIMYSAIDKDLQGVLNIINSMFYECTINKGMKRSSLSEIDFIKCNMYGCSFEHSRVTNSRFDTCSLKNAKISEAVFKRTVFMQVDFGLSSLQDAKFEDCSFIDCSFIGTNLEGANFNGCTINNPESINQAKGIEQSIMDKDFLERINSPALRR